MQPIAELIETLRASGGRITPQRIAVVEAIGKSISHPTVDEIFDEVVITQPSLSRKTVYQIVYDLADIGAISLVDVGTGQLRIDPTVEYEHDHFVCSQCRSVFDVERKRSPRPNKQVLEHGEIESVDVVYRGYCRNCAPSTN